MNFLAHLYLSGGDEKLMVGNFIGDFVKGRSALQKFERRIISGIELHRAIDEFTDTHPTVTQSKNRLRPKYRHYSGVIVDVFYDHFLAKNWTDYHAAPLKDFASFAYRLIENYDAVLPNEVKHMLPFMMKGNWLVNYSRVEGVARALSGMAGRTPYVSKMEEAGDDLIKYYGDFENEFSLFFPELSKYCQSRIRELNQAGA